MMTSPFVLKLRHGAPLTSADEAALGALADQAESVPARLDILREGTKQSAIPLIMKGWACRYRDLPNGKRQFTTLYLPGDLCEPFGALPSFTSDGLLALTPVVFARVGLHEIEQAAVRGPLVRRALWWDLLMASSIEREHLVSLGRRSASERIGHFFCEVHVRLTMIGQVNALSFDMPVTQNDMSDLLGLTSVHVNRSLQDLRRSGLITLNRRRLTINDLQGLRELSLFDPDYLHASRPIPAHPGGMLQVEQKKETAYAPRIY
jgi:CRP-like cAMP-binding protein